MAGKDRKHESALTRKIADEIRRGLDVKGMTQIELARALETKVTEATVNRWANAHVRPHAGTRPMIDRVLGTDVVGIMNEHERKEQ